VRFRILGATEVYAADGRRLAVGGARLRALLVLLLLDADRVVGVQRLIHGLYGDRPPARAGNALQSQVSRLRRLLADGTGSGPPLEFHPAGYRLAAARVRDATGAQGSGSRDHGARESKARPAAQLGGAHRNRASAVVTVAGGAHPRAADTPARLPATQHYRQSMSSARTACVQGGVPPGIGSNRPMITVRR